MKHTILVKEKSFLEIMKKENNEINFSEVKMIYTLLNNNYNILDIVQFDILSEKWYILTDFKKFKIISIFKEEKFIKKWFCILTLIPLNAGEVLKLKNSLK